MIGNAIAKYFKTLLCLFIASVSTSHIAYGSNCVKIRDSQDVFGCTSFDVKQISIAKKYNLKLGESYVKVKARLLAKGWKLDRAQLMKLDPDISHNDDMICGSGLDAICHNVFTKRKEALELTFSATNDGLPLIEVAQCTADLRC